jgi:hypothetical protein
MYELSDWYELSESSELSATLKSSAFKKCKQHKTPLRENDCSIELNVYGPKTCV